MAVRARLPPDAGAPPAALAVEAGGTEPAEPVPRTTATRTAQLTRVTIPSTTAPSTLPMGPHLRSGGGGQNEPRAQRTTGRSGDPSARKGRRGPRTPRVDQVHHRSGPDATPGRAAIGMLVHPGFRTGTGEDRQCSAPVSYTHLRAHETVLDI